MSQLVSYNILHYKKDFKMAHDLLEKRLVYIFKKLNNGERCGMYF